MLTPLLALALIGGISDGYNDDTATTGAHLYALRAQQLASQPVVRDVLPAAEDEVSDGYPARLVAHAAPGASPAAAVGDPAPTATPLVPNVGDAATATPAPPRTDPGGLVGLEAIVCALPWPCGEAIAVARCESGTDAEGRLDGNFATNGDSYGLYQINSVHAYLWPDFWSAWSDPARNTQWAFELWSQQGWSPWGCAP